jgi:hypothetical protein
MNANAKASLDGRHVVVELGPWSVELPIELAGRLKAQIEAALISAQGRRGDRAKPGYG